MAYLVTPNNSVVTERGHFGPNVPVEITDRDEAELLVSRGVIRDTKNDPIIPDLPPDVAMPDHPTGIPQKSKKEK